jgi:2-oxoisovalerate dehydrogenase E2 component (dihydrolipoyl transacylase)
MKIELPQVGESVTEAIVGRWLKQVGDRVEKYDPLVEVVTDKVNMEFPSPESGVLSSILVEEGQTVPMGAVIAEMDVDGESAREDEDDAAETETVDRTGTLLKDVAPVGPTGSGGPMTVAPAPRASKRYSPAVLRLAAEHDLDLSLVAGTGIGGRITRKDVEGYLDARTAAPKTAPGAPAQSADEERVPLTPVRRMIAANMVKSVTEIPEAWTVVEADVSGLVELREGAKAGFQRREGVNLTYLPFVVKAVAEALKESPIVNSTWGGDAIILKRRVNVGVAIATPDGLVVPVVRDADSLGVGDLAAAIDDLATRAREGKLKVADMQSGTFTINNTGALGSVTGKAIINYPQAAILNTEAIVKRPVVIGDAIAIRSIMNLCLTFDHRIMDGAEAGAFVSGVKRRLEAIGPEGPGI